MIREIPPLESIGETNFAYGLKVLQFGSVLLDHGKEVPTTIQMIMQKKRGKKSSKIVLYRLSTPFLGELWQPAETH